MAGKISDKELRLRALKLTNAYDQPGVIQRPLATSDRLIDIVNIYEHENWPRERVYCSQCNGHRHRRGFTALVSTSTGTLIRILLGSKCGTAAFGQNWNTAKRRMEGQHDRQWELSRLDRFDLILNDLRSTLLAWRGLVQKVVGRKSAFFLNMGELSSRLAEAYNHYNGHLFVHRTVTLQNGTHHQDTQALELLPGAALFNSLNMMSAIERSLSAIEDMAKSVTASDTVPTSELRKRRKCFEESLSDLRAVYEMYTAAQDFFTAETLAKIVQWTRRYAVTKTQYVWTGKSIENDHTSAEFAIPTPFTDLDYRCLELVEEYLRAD